jgi:penicillin-binding protein 1A
VHGISVAGGTFPAMIWHDFMNVAHGSYCEDFPQPTTPFVSSPFYGKYAKSGAPGDSSVPYGNQFYENGATQPGDDKKKRDGKSDDKTYDPRLYEAPPQPEPEPAPAPDPGPGNGNGNGNGQADPGATDGGGAAPPPAATGQTQG